MEIIKVNGRITAINVVDNVANIRLRTVLIENQNWQRPQVYKFKDIEFDVIFGYNAFIRPEAIARLYVGDLVEVQVQKANELSYSVKNITHIQKQPSLVGFITEIAGKQKDETVPEAYFDERPSDEEDLENE